MEEKRTEQNRIKERPYREHQEKKHKFETYIMNSTVFELVVDSLIPGSND